VEVVDGIGLALAPTDLGVFDVRQLREAMARETAVKGRMVQVRYCGMKGVEAVVEGQERVLAESDDGRLVLDL